MEPIKKTTLPHRLYVEDLEKIEGWFTPGMDTVALVVHMLVEEHDQSVTVEKKETNDRESLSEDELNALLSKSRSISQEEADKARPFSPYYYPRPQKEGWWSP